MRLHFVKILLISILGGCGPPPPEDIYIEISLLFVNRAEEEVLIKSKGGEIGFIGVFLLPNEEYLWEWDNIIKVSKDTVYFQTTFEFFKKGNLGDFREYMGDYIFKVNVYHECKYIDTCYIE